MYAALLVGFLFVPVAGRNFFGGGFVRYNQFFYLLPWANFDGEHYMSIAMDGYKSLEQAFFPIYPLLIHIGSFFLPKGFVSTALVGMIISNLGLLGGLGLLYKLVRLDFSAKVAWVTLILFLLFPTSFFLGAVYTESLFLFFLVGSFYFFRKKNYLLSGIFGALGSATRVFGILVFFALLIELWQEKVSLKKSMANFFNFTGSTKLYVLPIANGWRSFSFLSFANNCGSSASAANYFISAGSL